MFSRSLVRSVASAARHGQRHATATPLARLPRRRLLSSKPATESKVDAVAVAAKAAFDKEMAPTDKSAAVPELGTKLMFGAMFVMFGGFFALEWWQKYSKRQGEKRLLAADKGVGAVTLYAGPGNREVKQFASLGQTPLEELEKFDKERLRAACEQRGLKTWGRPRELAQRLVAHEQQAKNEC